MISSGEVLSFYLSRLLGMDNVPAVVLAKTNITSKQWRSVNISHLEWEDNKTIAFIQWIDHLNSGLRYFFCQSTLFWNITLISIAWVIPMHVFGPGFLRSKDMTVFPKPLTIGTFLTCIRGKIKDRKKICFLGEYQTNNYLVTITNSLMVCQSTSHTLVQNVLEKEAITKIFLHVFHSSFDPLPYNDDF